MLEFMSLFRRVFVLVLGAFLALGMSLPVVRAANMPVKMTMTSGIGISGHCKDCGDKGGASRDMGSCSLGCAAPVLAVIPQISPTRLEHISAPVLRQDSLLLGRAFSPDPDPPRCHDIG
jgi:hypothetical protein